MTSKFVVGLTGGIGSGKSAVTALFEKHDIDIIDADEVARDVVAIGSEGLAQISAYFGSDILLESGALDRAAMRERVFNNENEKAWLNELLHPLIRARMLDLINESLSPYCILSVPLLVENKLTSMCQCVVVVDCPEQMQLQRAIQRDGNNEQTIKNIMASQANREERLAAADYVLDNSTTIGSLASQINALHEKLLAQATA
ncbi:dephospho-CoA kinase [Alteromonas sp. KUL42]|uniref:dephospho-CoA kinase n=1 Tax=Alteromonas sp. KUL42 TaxID=2480797 RepID=UPI000797A9C7|nr:dephospho-CoA kinase [Alteromonas sp. KUL42]KXJ59125.1 MAG: dephospho-CoA kinase [Alteromonas sp. Nap_26]TAP38211.1 dephospho-CoA kinase [Alteromonas sp. KUL42]GEA05440.1 dephospho-CoA kinase [Alteromonas sp. KUL42]